MTTTRTTAWTETVLDFAGHAMPLVVCAGEDGAITGVRFGTAADHAGSLVDGDRDDTDQALGAAVEQLQRYAAGETTNFDLEIRFQGSDFQVAVWTALLEIPYGTTTSYGQVATAIGRRPSASRAIGSAVGSNPIAIIVPCHRVIGADGSLTGFGGGLENKVALLAREGVTAL